MWPSLALIMIVIAVTAWQAVQSQVPLTLRVSGNELINASGSPVPVSLGSGPDLVAVRAITGTRPGPDHPRTRTSRNNLAIARSRRSKRSVAAANTRTASPRMSNYRPDRT